MRLFRNLFNLVTVEEGREVINVYGLKQGTELVNQLTKLFNTTRVRTYMFNDIGNKSFSFYRYYALDIIYMLRDLANSAESLPGYVPVKLIKEIITQIEEKTWVKNTFSQVTSRLNWRRLSDFTVKPLKHQQDFFTHYDDVTQRNGLTGLMAAADAGTGKTLMGLMLMRMLPIDTVIVVCPLPTLLSVWEKTLNEFYGKTPTYWHSRMNTPIPDDVEYILIHYEYLNKIMGDITFNRRKTYSIILDESHNFNEMSNRTQYFTDLCEVSRSQHTLWLSGTPVKAVALETIPLIRNIDPLFTPKVEVRFRKAYAGSNIKMNQLLNTRLGTYMQRVKKEVLKLDPYINKDVLMKIPNGDYFTLVMIRGRMEAYFNERTAYYEARREEDHKVFFYCLSVFEETLRDSEQAGYTGYRQLLQTVVDAEGAIQNIPDQVKACNQYEKNIILPRLPQQLRKGFIEAKGIYKYVRLKIRGEVLGRIVGRARIECSVALAQQVDYLMLTQSATKKTLIFSNHVDTVDVATERCERIGLKPLTVHGGTSKNLANILKTLAVDESANPLITTYASLSTGVPLIACNRVILIDTPFRPHVLNQAIARVWRLGQDTQVDVIRIVLDTGDQPNISTRSVDIMEWARTNVKQVTGIDYVEGDVDVDESAMESYSAMDDTLYAALDDEQPSEDYVLLYPDQTSTLLYPTNTAFPMTVTGFPIPAYDRIPMDDVRLVVLDDMTRWSFVSPTVLHKANAETQGEYATNAVLVEDFMRLFYLTVWPLMLSPDIMSGFHAGAIRKLYSIPTGDDLVVLIDDIKQHRMTNTQHPVTKTPIPLATVRGGYVFNQWLENWLTAGNSMDDLMEVTSVILSDPE